MSVRDLLMAAGGLSTEGVLYTNDVFSSSIYTGNGSTRQTVSTAVDLFNNDGLAWIKGRSGATDHALCDTVRGNASDLVSNSTAAPTVQSTGIASLNGGYSWALSSTTLSNGIQCAAYGNGIFVLGGGNNGATITTSTNGTTWTTRTMTYPTSQTINKIIFANGLFVAVGTNGSLSTSPDGITWTIRVSTFVVTAGSHILDIVYGGGQFIIVGNKGPGTTPQIATSPDGITWTSRTLSNFGNNDISAISYGNNIYLVFSGSGASTPVATSSDGITWTTKTSVTISGGTPSITFGKGLFVLAHGSGSITTTTDGTTWTVRTAPTTSGSTNSVSFVSKMFITTANRGQIVISPDGILWYLTTTVDTAGLTLYTTAYNSSIFIVGASNGSVYTSATIGIGIGALTKVNTNNATYALSVFRKASKFFDVVSYTGTGANRTISHSLGISPGLIFVKRTDTTGEWEVYSNAIANTNYLALNTTAASATDATMWNSTTATSSVFSLGTNVNVNATGGTYVAYLFAHNSAVSGFIQCGSFTTDGSGNATVALGWEPQELIIKASSTTGGWLMMDSARPFNNNNSTATTSTLRAEAATAEIANSVAVYPTATGFQANGVGVTTTFIYMAIRRPNKPPTTGTEVYKAIARTGTGAIATVSGIGFAPDMIFGKNRSSVGAPNFEDRLRGPTYELLSSGAAADAAFVNDITSFTMDGMVLGTGVLGQKNILSATYIENFLKRSVGVFDVVCDTGTGANNTVAHSLEAVPDLIIRKSRSAATQWEVYCSALANTEKLVFNSTAAKATDATAWNSTNPTSVSFTVGTGTNVNTNAATYVSYLFANKAGISKIGTYTGNGTSQTIACGFSAGARFVLIKCTSTTGDWYVWDTARGIVSANDPHLSLNTTVAQVTTDDSVDPDNSGFIVNQVAATNINVTSATYIFLAIA